MVGLFEVVVYIYSIEITIVILRGLFRDNKNNEENLSFLTYYYHYYYYIQRELH